MSSSNRNSARSEYRNSYREQLASLQGGQGHSPGGEGSSASGSSSLSSGHAGPGESNGGKRNSSSSMNRRSSIPLDYASYGVLTGAVGGSFGPFPRSSTYQGNGAGAFSHRDSIASSDVGLELPRSPPAGGPPYAFYSDSPAAPGTPAGHGTPSPSTGSADRDSFLPHQRDSMGRPLSAYILNRSYSAGTDLDMAAAGVGGVGGLAGANATSALLWNKENAEADDLLHEPNDELDRLLYPKWRNWSLAGLFDTAALCIVVIVLVGLFAGWPIYRFAIKGGFPSLGDSIPGWSSGGINASGQVPSIPGLPTLVDADTPSSAYKRKGFDGETYNLVFSDEFNKDGRTFWPGDDPFWEAVDLNYWATTDLEWYDPDAITTEGGNLVITLSEQPIHDLNFRSGMLQSWNKFWQVELHTGRRFVKSHTFTFHSFTGGYIEINVSLPGTAQTQGYWPAAWTMGNLGRAGYGASLDGMWPYTYDSCDVGTLPNQTFPNGTYPTAAKTSGSHDYGGELSYLVGQRASACTCKGEDHPGPSVSKGRGAPEIDILEAQIASSGVIGSASQSIQIAPFDAGYQWLNETPYIEVWNNSITTQNQWHGSISQESLSLMTTTDTTSYGGNGFSTFSFEYDPGASGRITWAINGSQSWQLNADAIGPNSESLVGQRLISEEPMSIVLNLALSEKFQAPEWGKLTFPADFLIDYVRVYQKGTPNIGCDPSGFPTSDYINRHPEAYANPNRTTWLSIPNNTVPLNSLGATGCSSS